MKLLVDIYVLPLGWKKGSGLCAHRNFSNFIIKCKIKENWNHTIFLPQSTPSAVAIYKVILDSNLCLRVCHTFGLVLSVTRILAGFCKVCQINTIVGCLLEIDRHLMNIDIKLQKYLLCLHIIKGIYKYIYKHLQYFEYFEK